MPRSTLRRRAGIAIAAVLVGGLLASCDAAIAETDPARAARSTGSAATPAPSSTATDRAARTPAPTATPTARQARTARPDGPEHRDQRRAAKPPAANPNCTLQVPQAPLTAAGLATPYQLSATNPGAGACHERDTNQSAFVEATILDPATGALSTYRPLVVDAGTSPARPPVMPTLPPGAVVGVWFGFQGDVLTLRGGGGCTGGLPGSPFGQFGYCGAPAFFAAARAAVQAGKLVVPPLGAAADGRPCPTTRDFSVVDQDQSDNLTTTYVVLPDGRTAQDTAAAEALPGATTVSNASDNGLLVRALDPALGCRPYTAPDLSKGGAPAPSLALNELQAAAHQAAPVALVPPNDPMAKAGDRTSVAKTNLYRLGVDMPPLNPATETAAAYCRNLADVAPGRLALDRPFTSRAASPDPAAADSLFGFLTARFAASWTELGCRGDAPAVR